MIIWVASYPRSGNTFFRVLLHQFYDIDTMTVYQPSTPPPGAPITELMGVDVKTPPLRDMEVSDEYHFIKTHDMPSEDYPAIYLVRDGRDALVSHAHYVLHYDKGLSPDVSRDQFNDTLRSLISWNDSFGGWGPNVLAWTRRSTPTVTIRFEDLIRNPVIVFRQAMTDIGYHHAATNWDNLPTFDTLHEIEPQLFRKGQVGAWRTEMPADLQVLFWQRYGDAMRKMGYPE